MRIVVPLIAVLLLAGCYPSPVQPNDVDAERLETLAAEPVLAGGQRNPAEPNNTSANANALRAHVYVEQDWSMGGGSETWSLAQELLVELRAESWLIVQEICRVNSSGLQSAELVALKELEGFTAGMYVTIDTDGAALEAYAPFHEEDANPWGELAALEGGCLDGAEAPADDVVSGDDTDVGLFYLREE
jgi:hypothetical protein